MIFETRPDPVLQQHVDYPGLGRRVREIQGAQGMTRRELVLESFDQAGRGNRAGDKHDSNRLEWLRGQGFRRQSCPETMSVPGHGRETGDVVLAHEVVDLSPLQVRGALIATAAEYGVTGSRPGFRETRG